MNHPFSFEINEFCIIECFCEKRKKCVFASLLLAVAYEAISINSNQLAI